MSRITLSHLDPAKVTHPEDLAVIDRLNKIPGFKSFLNNTVVKYGESLADVTYTGDGYEISAKSNPKVYSQLVEDCRILGMENVPKMSALWGYFISSQSVGEKKRRVLLTSGAIDLLDSEELDFLIGHELGHILCGHMPYHTLVEALYNPLFQDNNALSIANLVKLPLLEWYRTSHYTADRMGLLCCQDINVALRTMIKMAGMPKEMYDKIDIRAFLRQADEFEEIHNSTLDRIAKIISIRSANSPWMVVRAKKLMEWYKSGEYQTILGRR